LLGASFASSFLAVFAAFAARFLSFMGWTFLFLFGVGKTRHLSVRFGWSTPHLKAKLCF
jgi:hypothetical protein